jgi:hypothetical protein
VVYRARAGTRQKISIAANGACNLAFSERDATAPLTVHDDKVLVQLSAVASRRPERRMRLCSFPSAGGDAVYTAAAMNENAGAIHDGL